MQESDFDKLRAFMAEFKVMTEQATVTFQTFLDQASERSKNNSKETKESSDTLAATEKKIKLTGGLCNATLSLAEHINNLLFNKAYYDNIYDDQNDERMQIAIYLSTAEKHLYSAAMQIMMVTVDYRDKLPASNAINEMDLEVDRRRIAWLARQLSDIQQRIEKERDKRIALRLKKQDGRE